jgi:hypothetical protein
MNAGSITSNFDVSMDNMESSPVLCIECFDSLQNIHNYRAIAKNMLMWLNLEHNKKHSCSGAIFNLMNTRLIVPKGNVLFTSFYSLLNVIIIYLTCVFCFLQLSSSTDKRGRL